MVKDENRFLVNEVWRVDIPFTRHNRQYHSNAHSKGLYQLEEKWVRIIPACLRLERNIWKMDTN